MSTYADHRAALNERAKIAHREWLKTLTPAQRKTLAAQGLDTINDSNEVGGHSPFSAADIAESPSASYEPDVAEKIDKPHQVFAETFDIPEATAKRILTWHRAATKEAVRKQEAVFLGLIVGGLLATENPKLSAAGLAFAVGLDALNGLGSQREFAKANHISPTAVSKVTLYWRTTLRLPTSVFQKSDEAREKYSSIGKNDHWRKRVINKKTASALLAKLNPPPCPTCN